MAARGYGREPRGGRWPVFTRILVDQGERTQRGRSQPETEETSRKTRQTSGRGQGQARGQGGTQMADTQDNKQRSPFMPQGTLTGSVDMAYFMGSTAGFTIWNKVRARKDKRDDLGWAVGEILLGTLFALSLSESVALTVAKEDAGDVFSRRRRSTFEASGPTTLLNVALGAAAAGMTYLLNDRPKS